jgi:hypothetical protein
MAPAERGTEMGVQRFPIAMGSQGPGSLRSLSLLRARQRPPIEQALAFDRDVAVRELVAMRQQPVRLEPTERSGVYLLPGDGAHLCYTDDPPARVRNARGQESAAIGWFAPSWPERMGRELLSQ